MRILWSSSSMQCSSGYGNVARQLIIRLKREGHFIRLATKHIYPGWNVWVDRPGLWHSFKNIEKAIESNNVKKALREVKKGYHELEGVEIFEGTNMAIINEMLEAEKFDYIFTHWDIWQLFGKTLPPKEKWVAYIPVDTEWISETLAEVSKQTGFQIALSKHGARELRSIGLNPLFAPHGIDIDIFRPKPEGREAFRSDFGWTDEYFIIGSVGLNYGDDRKGFIPLMMAFREFLSQHCEARLYLHTHAEGKYPGTINYQKIAHKLGIDAYVAFPHQGFNDTGRIDEEWLCDVYNGFDVFCLPQKGEGFGLPLCESAACGTPVATTATTTGPEFYKAGVVSWLINVDRLDDSRWLPNNTFRLEPRPSEILKALECAYNAWKYTEYRELKKQVREAAVREYGWDTVYERFWRPIFGMLEKELRKGKKKSPSQG